jgi:hypothetical protein
MSECRVIKKPIESDPYTKFPAVPPPSYVTPFILIFIIEASGRGLSCANSYMHVLTVLCTASLVPHSNLHLRFATNLLRLVQLISPFYS